MLLAVDIGNTNIKFGVFDGEDLVSKFSIRTDRQASVNDLGSAIHPRLRQPLNSAVVCSVVPDLDGPMRRFLSQQFDAEPYFVTVDSDLGLEIRHEPVSSIGTDRLVNSSAAVEKYGAPCIVCSFGTASTFDVVDENRVLIGGVIAPGMKLMAKALHDNTAKLPEVDVIKPAGVIESTTETAIRSGIFFGTIGLVEGLIRRLKNEFGGELKVVATGGFAKIIDDNTNSIDVVDEDLLLDGLRRLYVRNCAS
jgi:type III pantothenate kinase